MGGSRLSLVVKMNTLIMALVLLFSALMFVINERAFRKAVFDPCVKNLEQAKTSEKLLTPYFHSFLQVVGTEELDAVLAQCGTDRKPLREWMRRQPSMDEDPQTATLLDDFERFHALMVGICPVNDVDSSIVQIEKDGRTFMLCYADSNSSLLDVMGKSEPLEFFGAEETFLPPEDFAVPRIYEEAFFCNMVRCTQIDLGGDSRLNLWWMLDMTDEIQEHRQFILRNVLLGPGLIVLASILSMMLIRRFVTQPIRQLAQAAQKFRPEEDGTYSAEKILRAETGRGDEIGALSQDIRSMQEGILENTQKLALMTAEKERVRTELDMAARIQASVLPNTFPAFPDRGDFSVYASMTPAKEVAGDFYDFFLIDETHLGIVMADVSDKGVPAALFMMTARTLVQIYAKMKLGPSKTMRETNEWLSAHNKAGMFFTAWLGILDLSTGSISAVNAGHEYPVLRSGDGPYELLKDEHDFVVGALDNTQYTEYEIRMAPGDRLFLYTDGVPDAEAPDGQRFGRDRMLAALNQDPGAPLEQLLSNVHSAVNEFIRDAKQFDDLTMLCLEYKGPGGENGEVSQQLPRLLNMACHLRSE